MQVGSPEEQWDCQRKEVEQHRLTCWAGDTDLRFADGVIVVRSFDRVCTAKLVWDHGYGERALERGPYSSVHAHIGRVLRNGAAFGPVHTGDDADLRFIWFETDGSFRATRPHGEVRVKRFFDHHVLLFAPDGGFRLLRVSKDPDELKLTAEVYGPEWASYSGPRLAVRFEGRIRELHVSNNPSELAYHEIDEHTRFSLRPHRLPEGDEPAQAALYFFGPRGKARLLALVPIDATSDESLIYSDEQSVPSAPSQGRGRPTAETPGSSPASSSARPPEGETAGSSAMLPGLRDLVRQYLLEIAERPGGGPEMRAQCEHLLRAAERGANISGWGASLRDALERACDYKFSGGSRAFCYLVKALKDDGILARSWGRKCRLVFAELHRPDSQAIALLCERFGVTPESVLGTPERPTTGRTPPTTPPAGAPTPAVREPARTLPPVTRSPASPVASAPEPAPGGSPQATVEHAPEPRDARPAAPPKPVPGQPTDVDTPQWSPFGAAAPEDPFAAIQRLLSENAVSASLPTIPVSPPVSVAPPVRPVAPVAGTPPEDDFMQEEFLFLDRRILRSAREPTDEDLKLEDGDGLPRGPPDEE